MAFLRRAHLRLEAKDLFIEEYASDPVTTPEDQLVITVLVPIK